MCGCSWEFQEPIYRGNFILGVSAGLVYGCENNKARRAIIRSKIDNLQNINNIKINMACDRCAFQHITKSRCRRPICCRCRGGRGTRGDCRGRDWLCGSDVRLRRRWGQWTESAASCLTSFGDVSGFCKWRYGRSFLIANDIKDMLNKYFIIPNWRSNIIQTYYILNQIHPFHKQEKLLKQKTFWKQSHFTKKIDKK